MIKMILGLILLLSPFLLVYKFKDKRIGFAYILSFLLAFQLFLAVLLQAFGIFNYFVVLSINLLIMVIVSRKTNFKEIVENIKKINLKKNWVLIFTIIILFIYLYSVHYNYTGEITTVLGFEKVKNMKYPYPYFSDEWSAVSLIQYSIETGELPLINPLTHNSVFPNFELPFHSFISEIILLLNLNPLTQYTILTIFFGMLICLLIYLILRANKIGKFVSAISSLSALYIVNGANLPGIWNLMPITLGIISLLLGILFISLNKVRMSLFAAFLILIFYPPLFVFYSISLIVCFLFLKISNKEKIKFISLYLIVCLLVTLLLFIFAYAVIRNLNTVFHYIKIHIFYQTFTIDAIPDFSIFKIIPMPILFLSVIGFFKNIKKRAWLVSPVIVGLIFWLVYSNITFRLIIEYARIVFATSVLILVLSGFGLQYLMDYLNRIDFLKNYKILTIVQVVILISFFVLAFSYTQRENWKELKLYSVKDDGVFIPAAPANRYLHEDDLKLFREIKESNFLSIPWKGTVIGVSTENYPLLTKQSTITINLVNFEKFMNSNCAEKIEIAKKRKMKYVYGPEFNCAGFEIRGVSSEGLSLYEVNLQ